MLYLDILPAFTLYLLAFGAATLIASLTRARKPLLPYLWRTLLASTAGVLIANALLWAIVVTFGSILTATHASGGVGQVVGLPAALGVILRPIPASLFGAVAGIVFGVVWSRNAVRQGD